MGESTNEQRANWQAFECKADRMVTIQFGPDRIRVAPPTANAWSALADVLDFHGYAIRTDDTDSFNCRKITGGTALSLHAFGVALDVNWTTNPFRETPDQRHVRFSDKATQRQRAEEVKQHLADTDMTPQMITDVLAIRTAGGKRVFEWGGNWKNVKDPMHFEIDVAPDELADGIDKASVVRRSDGPAAGHVHPPAEASLAGAGEETRGSSVESSGAALTDSFDQIQPIIERWEGGFVDHPRDPGGPTNMGITLKTLESWRRHPVTREDVRMLSRAEARDIFRARYWTPLRCAEMPPAAALMTYNTGVLSGPGRAARILQDALNRQGSGLRIDGSIGSATIAACVKARQTELVSDYAQAYETFLRGLSNYDVFGKGWRSRLSDVQAFALDFVGSAVAEVPTRSGGPLVPLPELTMVSPSSGLALGARGERVRALQRALDTLRYPVGTIDGIYGTLTQGAVAAFQVANGLSGTGVADERMLTFLDQASARPLSPDRIGATAVTLRGLGSEIVKNADRTRTTGLVSTLLGILGISNSAVISVANSAAQTSAGGAPQAGAPAVLPQQSADFIQAIQQLRRLLPVETVNGNPALKQLLDVAETIRGAAPGRVPLTTMFDVLPSLFSDGALHTMASGAATLAGSLIPGVGGSVAALGIGLAVNYFGKRIIDRRVQDHKNADSIGAIKAS